MSDAFKNILIIKPSALGDIIQALPALSALRRSFPDAEISWLIRPEFAPLIENHPHLTRTVHFRRKHLGKAWFHPGALASLLSFIRRLHRAEFDLVFDFQGLIRTGLFARFTSSRKRFGMAAAREFGHLFYTDKVPQDPTCVHLVDYYLKMARAAGAQDSPPQFVLPVDPAAADSVAALLDDHHIQQGRYVVLVPGSAHPDKCWPLERFAALADIIAADFNLSILAVGTPAEAEMIDKIVAAADCNITNLAGRTAISQLVALLSHAALVVSNDTGPGHIASALAIPTVMIFGRSNPARVAPYNKQNALAAIEPAGRGLLADNYDPKYAITNISLDHVLKNIRAQLKP